MGCVSSSRVSCARRAIRAGLGSSSAPGRYPNNPPAEAASGLASDDGARAPADAANTTPRLAAPKQLCVRQARNFGAARASSTSQAQAGADAGAAAAPFVPAGPGVPAGHVAGGWRGRTGQDALRETQILRDGTACSGRIALCGPQTRHAGGVMLCGCARLRSSRPKTHHCPGVQAGAPAAGPQRAFEHTRSCCATGMRPRTACMALRTTDDPLDERARGKRQAAKEVLPRGACFASAPPKALAPGAMGCASSAPAADGAAPAKKGVAVTKAASDAAAARGEDLTPAALALMRSDFLKHISPGSLLDTYVMGDIIGASAETGFADGSSARAAAALGYIGRAAARAHRRLRHGAAGSHALRRRCTGRAGLSRARVTTPRTRGRQSAHALRSA